MDIKCAKDLLLKSEHLCLINPLGVIILGLMFAFSLYLVCHRDHIMAYIYTGENMILRFVHHGIEPAGLPGYLLIVMLAIIGARILYPLGLSYLDEPNIWTYENIIDILAIIALFLCCLNLIYNNLVWIVCNLIEERWFYKYISLAIMMSIYILIQLEIIDADIYTIIAVNTLAALVPHLFRKEIVAFYKLVLEMIPGASRVNQ